MHWGMYSVPSWDDLSPRRRDAAQYWRFVQSAPGCPKASCRRAVRRQGANNSVRAFHRRTYPAVAEYSDFVPLYAAPLFNATAWAELFAAAGASHAPGRQVRRWVDALAVEHDGREMELGHRRPAPRRRRRALRRGARARMKVGVHFELSEWLDNATLRRVLPAGRALSAIEPERYRDEVAWAQLTELVETYRPDDVYTDSEWDWSSTWWKSREWLAWLFNDSPVRDHVVVNDRWGNETRGNHGTYFVCEYSACTGSSMAGHPWTKTLSINSRFGYNRADRAADLKNATYLLHELAHSASQGGNLDLSVDATGDGARDPYHQQVLLEMGRWLGVNGAAIYATTLSAARQNYTTADGTLVYFTSGASADLYAIATRWPGASLSLPLDSRPCPSSASLLGLPSLALAVHCDPTRVSIAIPPLPAGAVGGEGLRHAFAFRLSFT